MVAEAGIAPVSAPPGHIGRYEVVAPVGEGGMGRVYLAVLREPPEPTKLVVLKQLRSELQTDPQFVAMFANEARIALRLRHPNIVRTYEAVVEPDNHFLAMEYLEGLTLAEVLGGIGRREMPLEEHLWILARTLAGLHHAHQLCDENGAPLAVVHRDVSPTNVFITSGGEVKLLDFGIAKVAGAVATTAAGVMKGKIGYAAPEQCLGHHVDARADLYAVGVMLWEALARKRRAVAETDRARMQARVQGDEPPIEDVWPAVPPALATICRRALARARQDRYATALEFRKHLELWLRSRGLKMGSPEIARLLAARFGNRGGAQTTRVERHPLPRAGGLGVGALPSGSALLQGGATVVTALAEVPGAIPHTLLEGIDPNLASTPRPRPRRRGVLLALLPLALALPVATVIHRWRLMRSPPLGAIEPVPSSGPAAARTPALGSARAPDAGVGEATRRGLVAQDDLAEPERRPARGKVRKAPARTDCGDRCLQPGMDLRRSRRTRVPRNIEEQDPYQ